MDETLTIKEAAEQLGMSPDVLRVYIHRKKIQAHKRGSMWFIPAAALATYTKRRHAQAT